MRISSSKSDTMVLRRKRVKCPLHVRNELLLQVEEMKYFRVLFMSEERGEREWETDRWIGAVSTVMRMLYQSFVITCGEGRAERKSEVVNLWVDLHSYILTLTYGHRLWVMTERIKSWTQAVGMNFL